MVATTQQQEVHTSTKDITHQTKGSVASMPLSELVPFHKTLPNFKDDKSAYARFNAQAPLIEGATVDLLISKHGWARKPSSTGEVVLEKECEGELILRGGIACLNGQFALPADIHAFLKGYASVDEFLLHEGYEQKKQETVALDTLLQRCRLTDKTDIPESRPLLRLGGVQIATNANLVDVVAQSKAGKTALLSGAVAAAVSGETHLGWESVNPSGAIIYIDTEQSLADCKRSVIDTAMRRCGCEGMPKNLLVYNVKRERAEDAWRLLKYAIEVAQKDFGAVFVVIIDGVADLVKSVNDEEESTRLVAELLELATEYDTSIITVLHANPGARNVPGDFSKGRGHLGSQLERKCETLITLRKNDESQVTRITAPVTRGKPLSGTDALQMAWDEASSMFQLVEPQSEILGDAAIREVDQFKLAWGDDLEREWTKPELIKRLQDGVIMGDLIVSESTARRLFRSWCPSDSMALRAGGAEHEWLVPGTGKAFRLHEDHRNVLKQVQTQEASV